MKKKEVKRMIDSIHSLNLGDNVALEHSTYGSIMFDVCAKDYLVPGTVTLVSRRCVANMKWNKNSNMNHYSKSSIRHWLNTEFLNGFDDSVINAIKTPDWECHDGTTPIILNDKIAIPSMTEMGIDYPYSQTEGTAFAYKNIAGKFNGTVDGKSAVWYCWTRTPDSEDYTDFACYFISSGSGDYSYCSFSFGVPVCFII